MIWRKGLIVEKLENMIKMGRIKKILMSKEIWGMIKIQNTKRAQINFILLALSLLLFSCWHNVKNSKNQSLTIKNGVIVFTNVDKFIFFETVLKDSLRQASQNLSNMIIKEGFMVRHYDEPTSRKLHQLQTRALEQNSGTLKLDNFADSLFIDTNKIRYTPVRITFSTYNPKYVDYSFNKTVKNLSFFSFDTLKFNFATNFNTNLLTVMETGK